MPTTPEAILEWLHNEMGYRSLAGAGKSHLPSADSLRRICRGNMLPAWDFLITRAKSEKKVQNIRRNIKVRGDEGSEEATRKVAMQEMDAAVKEVERLRNAVRKQREDLRAIMLDVSNKEAKRKRMLDERSNYRHKQVMLEAYDRQCDEAVKIFAEYHKRLCYYVNQARNAQRSDVDSSVETTHSFRAKNEKEAVYSTVKSSKSAAADVILIESTREKHIRKVCEYLAAYMVEKIRNSFPAFEGSGIHSNPQAEMAKLGFDFDGQIPDEVRTVIEHCLKSPLQLLKAITAYTLQLKSLISREKEKIDVRADTETLRYKYDMDVSSFDGSPPLHNELYGNGKIGVNVPPVGSQSYLLKRQKDHVKLFLDTEDVLNKAAEAKDFSEKLMKRLQGGTDVGSLRRLELDIWAMEREVAGLEESLNTLNFQKQRLIESCTERKNAEDSLKKKWKMIEEFDARRSELETIYTALLKVNMDAASFWSQQPLTAREYASSTITPACAAVIETSNSAKDLIEREVCAFCRSPDNSLYMLPSSPQALLEAMGASGLPRREAVGNAEMNAAILTARAGAQDPSAIPSICRVSAALQYPAGLEDSDAGLASVLNSLKSLELLEFCLKLRGSEASLLEDLLKAINLVHVRRGLVQSGHDLAEHAYRVQQRYEGTASFCLNLAAEQEKTVMEEWLPELQNAVSSAPQSFKDCKYVRGLLDEWWEQPASTVVDWVTVEGQNVAAWHCHVKQLLAFCDKELFESNY